MQTLTDFILTLSAASSLCVVVVALAYVQAIFDVDVTDEVKFKCHKKTSVNFSGQHQLTRQEKMCQQMIQQR